jgi:hypothetical protein
MDNEEDELPDVRSRGLRNSQTPEPGQPTDRISTRRAAGQRALEEIREMQKAGLQPTVRTMTVHYIENRAVPVDKFPDQNDNGNSSSHDIVDQIDDCRCECNSRNECKPDLMVSCQPGLSWNTQISLIRCRSNVLAADSSSTPSAMDTETEKTTGFPRFTTATAA